MRIAYCSDLHIEINGKPMRNWPEADVLILAGDIITAAHLEAKRNDADSRGIKKAGKYLLKEVFPRYGKVLMVMGNHEHYNYVYHQTPQMIGDFFSSASNYHLMDRTHVEYMDWNFFGATLWTDFNKGDSYAMWTAQRGMNDFRLIKSRMQEAGEVVRGVKAPAITPEFIYDEHRFQLAWLGTELDKNKTKNCAVITHHPPLWVSLNRAHSGNGLDAAFASDLEMFLDKHDYVRYWFHGHTHANFDYECHGTRVLANQMGYNWEPQSSKFEVKVLNVSDDARNCDTSS